MAEHEVIGMSCPVCMITIDFPKHDHSFGVKGLESSVAQSNGWNPIDHGLENTAEPDLQSLAQWNGSVHEPALQATKCDICNVQSVQHGVLFKGAIAKSNP